MNIEKYCVKKIEEPDYGCEERPAGEKKMDRVLLLGNHEKEKWIQVEDALLYERGIDEGTTVVCSSEYGLLKVLPVVGAIIWREGQGVRQIFATQRGYGPMKDGWEFPGGKIEPPETPEEAVIREIKEELDTKIKVTGFFQTVEYDYPTFHLSMDCFLCQVEKGALTLLEHEAAKWLKKEELFSVDWLPADKGLIKELETRFFE